MPEVATEVTTVETVSDRSASRTVKVPLVLRAALVSVRAAVAVSVGAAAWTLMSGASLVPVMVITTVWVSDAALVSVDVTV